MKHLLFSKLLSLGVKSLTLVLLAGCTSMRYHTAENCKTRAYQRTPLHQYLSSRYERGAPVRMAVVPFSAPANLTAYNNEQPGLGNQVAWELRRSLLAHHEVPIIEIFSRQAWPGKKEEFYAGNYGMLSRAAHAGYDLLLVGAIHNLKSLNSLSASAKLIEVETGTTIWNAKSTASIEKTPLGQVRAQLGYDKEDPSMLYTNDLADQLVHCLETDLMSDEPLP